MLKKILLFYYLHSKKNTLSKWSSITISSIIFYLLLLLFLEFTFSYHINQLEEKNKVWSNAIDLKNVKLGLAATDICKKTKDEQVKDKTCSIAKNILNRYADQIDKSSLEKLNYHPDLLEFELKSLILHYETKNNITYKDHLDSMLSDTLKYILEKLPESLFWLVFIFVTFTISYMVHVAIIFGKFTPKWLFEGI
ncbi:hypothetical protein [Vibrio mimicus]|nr:hypothetical protein [Vibrio mimicus]